MQRVREEVREIGNRLLISAGYATFTAYRKCRQASCAGLDLVNKTIGILPALVGKVFSYVFQVVKRIARPIYWAHTHLPRNL